MKTINAQDSVLDLNPRQIYIIKRRNTQRIVDSINSFVEEFDEFDLMQFHIIDLTGLDDEPEQKSTLYKDFQDEGGSRGAWDIIVRDYPESQGSLSFSAFHFKKNSKENKEQLLEVKEQLEDIIWDKVAMQFNRNLIITSTNANINENFTVFLKRVLESQHVDPAEWQSRINTFTSDYLQSDRFNRKDVIREFIGNRFDVMDEYMGFCAWDKSNVMMENFMQNGCSGSSYGISILKNEDLSVSPKDNHANFIIKIVASDGKEHYPHFSGVLNFALYIMLMKKQGSKLSKKAFDFQKEGNSSASPLCERIMAILATVKGYCLYLPKDQKYLEECYNIIRKFATDKKAWNNGSAIRPSLEDALGNKTVNFLSEDLHKGEKWVEVPTDHICFDKRFDDVYKKNLQYIQGKCLFQKGE